MTEFGVGDGVADDPENGDGLEDGVAVVEETADEDEVEPVELLVQLAEEGEIEPWDIDIVAVTDAFLERLDATDLRTSGRALFYASVLLRMKSDELLAPEEPEAPEPEPWELAMEGGEDVAPGFDPIDALEDEMDRRLERRSARGSPETLDELVHELREAERGSWWKRSREYDTTASPRGFSRGTQTLDYHAADDLRRDGEPGEDDVTGTAHDEHIETTIETVEAHLSEQYDRGRDEVLFAELSGVGGRPVETYLALLFLAHRSVVTLEQDDLFGDLWVQSRDEEAEKTPAVAD